MQDDQEERRDSAWVEAVRAGDNQAFSELYRCHAPAVRTIATAFLHDRDAVDDVVQETFTRALHRIDRLRAPDRFRAWLFEIARNCATDVLRRRALETPAPLPAEGDRAVFDRPAPNLGPAELAELAELARLVDGSVVGLTARDATAVMMMTGLGFGSADVAEVLGVSPGAAKVLAHRARGRLRQSLTLQLLVRLRGRHCPELAELFDAGDPVAAARHVRRCAPCRETAAAEVLLYSLQTDDADALGAERVDQGVGHRVGPPLDQAEP